MAEWFKAHAWKVCWVQALAGSNPVLSARISDHNPLWLKILLNEHASHLIDAVEGSIVKDSRRCLHRERLQIIQSNPVKVNNLLHHKNMCNLGYSFGANWFGMIATFIGDSMPKQSNNMNESSAQLGIGLAIGVIVGVGIGVMMGNATIGIGLGLALGAVIGGIFIATSQQDRIDH